VGHMDRPFHHNHPIVYYWRGHVMAVGSTVDRICDLICEISVIIFDRFSDIFRELLYSGVKLLLGQCLRGHGRGRND
jgi:hypothetical protein